MHEIKLKQYFENSISAEELNINLLGAAKKTAPNMTGHYIIDMNEKFTVTAEHVEKLCVDVINRKIDPEHLESISFCIIASDNFLIGNKSPVELEMLDILHEWSTPVINYPLNIANIRLCLKRLKRK